MPENNEKTINKLASRTKIYMAIIAILLIVICIYDLKFIIPSLIFYVGIIFYSVWVSKKGSSEISNHIQEMVFDIDSTAKRTLVNSPFPLVIVETDGNIVWKSSKFINEFMNIDINTYLEEIIKEVKQEISANKRQMTEKSILIGYKTYKVIGEYVKSKKRDKKNEYLMTLYFVDITELEDTKKMFDETKSCVGIIMIDNYDEISKMIPKEDMSQIIANIEKSIYDWVEVNGGFAVKTERDTFIYLFEKQYLNGIKENRFDILDKVKDASEDGKAPITLSIAISADGDTNYEKHSMAQATLELALGRGGDQAVVRENGRYEFFGGRAQEVEKITKVKARVVATALEELIQEARNVIIMGHTNSDIDSLASGIGIYKLAVTLGKPAYIVNNTVGLSVDEFLTELKKDKQYKEAIIDKNDANSLISGDTLLVITDTCKKNYVDVPELLDKTEKIVVIDHHRKSTDVIENPILSFHEVYASSACELVIEILQYAETDVELSEIEAEGLYAGIMVDTKNFTFKTGVRTFEAAAYLRKCGVDILRVKKWFQSNLENYNIIADIVKNAEVMEGQIAISQYEVENKDTNTICAKAADELLTINNINASFVLGKMGDKVYISGRSIGEINVQLILEKMRWWRTYNTSWCTN